MTHNDEWRKGGICVRARLAFLYRTFPNTIEGSALL